MAQIFRESIPAMRFIGKGNVILDYCYLIEK